ncbi:hypothetical protein DIPPA_21235 [Diplonema papillatum]|nr:hypothetical protein DIPPA_21235 [Diplonema papillatum]
MLRRCLRLSVALTSPHHPSFKSTPRAEVCTFQARLEVDRVNREIARLMIIRDETLASEFHVARIANGRFKLGPKKRSDITHEVVCLKRRKMLLVDYIKRNEVLNAQFREQSEKATATSEQG